jgi:hypothetical protein
MRAAYPDAAPGRPPAVVAAPRRCELDAAVSALDDRTMANFMHADVNARAAVLMS